MELAVKGWIQHCHSLTMIVRLIVLSGYLTCETLLVSLCKWWYSEWSITAVNITWSWSYFWFQCPIGCINGKHTHTNCVIIRSKLITWDLCTKANYLVCGYNCFESTRLYITCWSGYCPRQLLLLIIYWLYDMHWMVSSRVTFAFTADHSCEWYYGTQYPRSLSGVFSSVSTDSAIGSHKS